MYIVAAVQYGWCAYWWTKFRYLVTSCCFKEMGGAGVFFMDFRLLIYKFKYSNIICLQWLDFHCRILQRRMCCSCRFRYISTGWTDCEYFQRSSDCGLLKKNSETTNLTLSTVVLLSENDFWVFLLMGASFSWYWFSNHQAPCLCCVLCVVCDHLGDCGGD